MRIAQAVSRRIDKPRCAKGQLVDYNFKGGASVTSEEIPGASSPGKECIDLKSSRADPEDDISSDFSFILSSDSYPITGDDLKYDEEDYLPSPGAEVDYLQALQLAMELTCSSSPYRSQQTSQGNEELKLNENVADILSPDESEKSSVFMGIRMSTLPRNF